MDNILNKAKEVYCNNKRLIKTAAVCVGALAGNEMENDRLRKENEILKEENRKLKEQIIDCLTKDNHY